MASLGAPIPKAAARTSAAALRGRSPGLGPARAVEMAALGDSLVDNPVGPGLTLEQSSSESKEDDDDDAELELVADEEHLRRLGALLSNARGGASALTKTAHAVLVAAALWIGLKGAGQSDPVFMAWLVFTGAVMQDQFVFFEGQLGKKMYIVESGELAVIRKNKEKCAPTCATPSQNPRCKHCIQLGRQGTKSFFGELAVMGAGTWQRRRRSIRAIENCKLSSLSKDSLDSLRRDYPELNHQMFQVAQKIVCEGIGNITNIELENEPASKLDIDKLNRKVEGLEAKMDRLLTHLSVPEDKAEQREAQLLARSESAEMYTPGGSFDLAKATTEVAPEEGDGALARGGAGSAGKKVRRVLSVRAATSSRRVAAAQSAPGPSPGQASGGDRASRDSSSSLGSSSERRSSRTVLSASGLTEIEPTTPRGSPGPSALRGP
eukprot:COSAG04_NODE_78_length_28355_cov_17.016457_15_plen_436_part_00